MKKKLLLIALAAASIMIGASGVSYAKIPEKYDFESSYYLIHSDFASLEKKFAESLAAYKRGDINEDVLYQIFMKLAGNSDDSTETSYNNWVAKYPNSYAAVTARGYFLYQKAWRIRGGAFAKDTSSEQFSGFRSSLRKARQDLLKSLALFDKPTISYDDLIGIAGGLGTDEEKELRDRALRIDPMAYHPRAMYLTFAAPKWGGSIKLMDEALAEAKRSGMPDDMKQRMQGDYDYELAFYAEADDRAADALSLYWKANGEYPNGSYNALERGAILALKVQQFDWAMKFLDKVIVARPKWAWAYRQRAEINEMQYKLLPNAFDDYSTAAQLGDTFAEQHLGWWYINGIYVKRDPDMAEKYWKRAAAKGDEHSIHNLKHLAEMRGQGAK